MLEDHGKLNGSGRRTRNALLTFLTVSRLNFGGNESSSALRFPFDKYDRLWYGAPAPGGDGSTPFPVTMNNTSFDVNSRSMEFVNSSVFNQTENADDIFQVPPAVWTSAWEGISLNSVISFTLDIGSYSQRTREYALSVYLFDVDSDGGDSNNSRSVDIYNADVSDDGNVEGREWIAQNTDVLTAAKKVISDMKYEFTAGTSIFNISRALNSSRPAMINAFELYAVFQADVRKMDDDDFEAIRSVVNILSNNVNLDTFGDPCNPIPWSWLDCDISSSRITEINLTDSRLDGEFKEDVYFPPKLSILDLSRNNFSGVLPSSLRFLTDLVKLDVSGNNFAGSITIFHGDENGTSGLQYLNLSSNHMSGHISGFNERMLNLTTLDLSDNDFVGRLPNFSLPQLEFLNLSSNHMSGDLYDILYSQFSDLHPLRILILKQNNFSGVVLDEIWGPLSQLQTVDLSYNSFTELDLTSWCHALLNALLNDESFIIQQQQVLQQVNLVNNSIERVRFGSALSRVQSKKDASIYKLLGGNKWCESVGLPEARILERYLCRRSDGEDYYWGYLQLTGSALTKYLTIGLSVSGVVALVIACLLLICLVRVWKRTEHLRQIQDELARDDVRPPFYKYEDLKAATRDFSTENELGRGGFGAVYMATLEDKSIVAVKFLFEMEQNLTDFLKETVLITGIKHRNLIQLKGCCVRDKKRMLVYEYSENGTLAQALWSNNGASTLTWAQRLNICVGVAKGLCYLNEELQPRIIHRDIKPQNILLDKDWNPKIADFGLARSMKGDEGTLATCVGGTVGYLAPEYASQGLITEKLDVFSYGILLLEIISNRKCIDSSAPPDEVYLRTWAFKLYKEGCLSKMAQPSLLAMISAAEIEWVLKIALSCIQEVYEKRPSMSEVVSMLTGHISDVAIDIVEQLRDQQILYFETSAEIPEMEGTGDEVLLHTMSSSYPYSN
ncbi:hypothetical protein R1sor_003288 [Riccia sorocarpa]|uniref:non-specific serine/threonine protein kinase n=1 Tax=Riccia sorocarpa TaxID=122646 RepID=A0ABD3H2T7_9MARC